eukprot:1937843-Pleurochrysis_carterae.AAC.1
MQAKTLAEMVRLEIGHDAAKLVEVDLVRFPMAPDLMQIDCMKNIKFRAKYAIHKVRRQKNLKAGGMQANTRVHLTDATPCTTLAVEVGEPTRSL